MTFTPGQVITLNQGNGYYVNGRNLFGRLKSDISAIITDVRPGRIWVTLPESCEYAKNGKAEFQVFAVKGYAEELGF